MYDANYLGIDRKKSYKNEEVYLLPLHFNLGINNLADKIWSLDGKFLIGPAKNLAGLSGGSI